MISSSFPHTPLLLLTGSTFLSGALFFFPFSSFPRAGSRDVSIDLFLIGGFCNTRSTPKSARWKDWRDSPRGNNLSDFVIKGKKRIIGEEDVC